MSLFNNKQYYSQRENVYENSNRIVNMWNFIVDFTLYFQSYSNIKDMNDLFRYNVKSVTLPKYTMKTYKRYYGTSERTFPIKRVCDGVLSITFYCRYELVYALCRLGQNFIGSEEISQGIEKTMKNGEIINLKNIEYNRDFKSTCIEVLQLPDNLYKDGGGCIRYTFMKPILTSIEYSELNSEGNSILEVTCEFSYNDFRITTDTLHSKAEVMRLDVLAPKTEMIIEDSIDKKSLRQLTGLE